MLYLFKLLLLLIKIDEETVLKWFGMTDTPNPLDYIYGYDIPQKSTDISLTTFQLIVEGLWNKVQDGLTLADIENILFFILFIRFVILAIRYNLKTSFFITCIGLCAGYLWYRHLIDLISMYRNVLLKLPYLNKLGRDAVQLRSLHRQMYLTDLKMGDLTHWYNPGQVIYNGFTKGIVHIDPESGQRFYIDPISMIISNLPEPIKSSVIPVYYKIYNGVIPKIYNMCTKFWNQLSGIAAYALITRIGKRYCPYLIRWHWTLLLIMGMVESFIIYFIYRAHYFQTYILLPQKKALAVNTGGLITSTLDIDMQMQLLNACICTIVLAHLGFVIFALFHAVWGQYFYFPFFVENTELHVGPRPANSIYSGGQTAWQTPEEKNKLIPKLWYGWFGRGTKNQWNFIGSFFTKVLKKFFRKKKKR
jgi:hypothetical protein